jgi:hypothetical protein
MKIGSKRLMDRFILPRILGASNGSPSAAAQGGY